MENIYLDNQYQVFFKYCSAEQLTLISSERHKREDIQ